ncbi:hypothetical protein TGAMA5MH_06878 [Trichoderma gamsii]|uniref:Sodium/calcium exchanger membrane region domain-containing protein n=1 Tax=Trichoderma gamsii TaxID=398673 RepID=A0A2K0T654_9HYPO|nr:hypothetical protein TGAMA5MH_06878 [Trichoderma gamsii]
MAQANIIAFNIGAFISTLFLLESGADKFTAHAAALASRIGISEVTIGLVTAGAEWEELAVVVASLAQGRPSLAMGNVIGSAISNILGAFSLGLLCFEGEGIEFDRSARIYSLLTVVLTTLVVPVVYFPNGIVWLVCGPLLVLVFGMYFLFVAVAIGRGVLAAPQDSDSESDDDDDDEDDASSVGSTTGLLADGSTLRARQRRNHHQLLYHGFYLVFGFLAICLAGYVLSQAAINTIDQLHTSDMLFGIVVLAIATTLPEKFIAVMSGRRGHPGILVANCAGSNIFLLTLCCGIIMMDADAEGGLGRENVTMAELAVLWVSTALFAGTVWFGGRVSRWIGGGMVLGYVGFIVLEVAVVHKVGD